MQEVEVPLIVAPEHESAALVPFPIAASSRAIVAPLNTV